MISDTGTNGMGQAGSLARNLVSLVDAVAELRTAQQNAAQAAAARQTAERLHAAFSQARNRVPHAGRAHGQTNRPGGPLRRADAEFPVSVMEILAAAAAHESTDIRSGPQVMLPPTRARPGR
jgi:hypothetical protein